MSEQTRAIKKLRATSEAGAYQKAWFQGLRERVEAGEDFGYLNADVPMEILRAMDIPFVVNQWWAAICGAKRMTKKYFGLLRDAGLQGRPVQLLRNGLCREPGSGRPRIRRRREATGALGRPSQADHRNHTAHM